MPVLESALERSVELAAAMDARGFGRATGNRRTRLVTGGLTSGGLLGVCIGSYGLLDAGSPPALGLPLLLLGVVLAAGGLVVGGRRATRSRYRPDPWSAPEWLTTLQRCGRRDNRARRRQQRRRRRAHPGGDWPAQPAAGGGRRRARGDPAGVAHAHHPAGATATPRVRQISTTEDHRLSGAARAMIRFEDVSVRYPGGDHPVLSRVDLTVPEGELCLVVGRTGSGKSTLLRAVNGLVPHFTGGLLSGRVTVAGRDTRDHPPRELADIVGYVGQDPLATFVTDVVEEELAYGMESQGLAGDVMRRRVEEVLDLLGMAEVRDRPLMSLSAGQQQRVAIGSVLAAHPRVLVLDEPTSALDPPAAEEVLALLQRLVHDLGLTVLLAEHRLERVVQYADRIVLLPGQVAPGRRRAARRGDDDRRRWRRPSSSCATGGLDTAAAVGARRTTPGRPSCATGCKRPCHATP